VAKILLRDLLILVIMFFFSFSLSRV
jgi:hypothetical protein